MRKILISIALLFGLVCFGQELNQKIEKIEGELFIISHGEKFLLNKQLLCVKPISVSNELESEYKISHISKMGYYYIQVPEGRDVVDLLKELQETKKYESVSFVSTEGYVYLTPTDSQASTQSDYLSMINAYNAWNFTTGSQYVRVAVIDTGFRRDHEDIGYGNDSYSNSNYSLGYDYYTSTSYTYPDDSHGTMVAGLIGAKMNNGIGIAGISGGNHSKGVDLISYRLGYWCNYDHLSGHPEKMGDAIVQAVDDGAKVINISIGANESPDINSAISYAYNHNVTIVCAAGYLNATEVPYPASHPYTIAVGAFNQHDNQAYTDLGYGLDLVAPGYLINSTSLTGYGALPGTSYAAPLVSGTVALMLSINQTLTPNNIRNILRKTASKPSGYTYNNAGWNSEVGYGILNSYEAVKGAYGSISGSPYIYNSESYYVDGLPPGYNVVWSLSDNYYNQYCLQNNTPSSNQCTITRAVGHNMQNATLTATIKLGLVSVCSLTMTVNAYDGFMGTYYNGQTTVEINLPYPLFVLPNTIVKITSPNLVGASASYTSDTPITQWSLDNSNGILYVGMPSYGACVVSVSCTDGSSYSIPILISTSLNALSVGVADGHLEVSPASESNLNTIYEDISWTLDVYNATSLEKVFAKTVKGKSYVIDTTGWKHGVYVVKVTIGKEVYSEKVVIK